VSKIKRGIYMGLFKNSRHIASKEEFIKSFMQLVAIKKVVKSQNKLYTLWEVKGDVLLFRFNNKRHTSIDNYLYIDSIHLVGTPEKELLCLGNKLLDFILLSAEKGWNINDFYFERVYENIFIRRYSEKNDIGKQDLEFVVVEDNREKNTGVLNVFWEGDKV
jgi:hypothetical protein